MRDITHHVMTWRGLTIRLRYEQYRFGKFGGDAFHLETVNGAPLPAAHWDERDDAIGFCADIGMVEAIGCPVQYAINYLDASAKGNAKFIEASRQGVLI